MLCRGLKVGPVSVQLAVDTEASAAGELWSSMGARGVGGCSVQLAHHQCRLSSVVSLDLRRDYEAPFLVRPDRPPLGKD